ncbi:redoxin family protein [Chitinophaga polysaccharea]|uniref:TlpA family protein disulfide reductase n=1 Tax=Chitinophaga polysaccharea TaxID=1293035 RepID=UPI0014555BEA|nr:redoxin family protein [Chitinophaga polysaccharea]NLR62301.1 redoxin family protein [Chitinophaga polysaccharea]
MISSLIKTGIVILIGGLVLFVGVRKFIQYSPLKANFVPDGQTQIEKGFKGTSIPAFDFLLSDSSTHANTGGIPTGKYTIFFYFGPDCPYCQSEMREIIKGIDDFKDVRFYLLTAYPVSEMNEFMKLFQLNRYENIVVGFDYRSKVGPYYKIRAIPYTIIFNKDNKLIDAFEGNLTYTQIRNIIL